MHDKFYVLTSHFNPWRYKARTKLYHEFAEYVQKSGGILYTVELALGERPYEVTDPTNPRHLQLRSHHEMWHKERMLNLLCQRLPQNWYYAAWIDADIRFARTDWVQETTQLLQHYKVLQMFSQAQNLHPNYESTSYLRKGFIKAWVDGDSLGASEYYGLPHPGFAWAMRKDGWNELGGLIDTAILGSADLHMARALVGDVTIGLPKGISPGYIETLQLWKDRADRNVRQNVGCMDGLVYHYWHGKRVDRRYNDRWKILVEEQYDSELDIYPDWQGLYKFSGRNPKLRYRIRQYLSSRNEDSIDLA